MVDQQNTGTKRWLRNRRSQRIMMNVSVVVHRRSSEGPQFSEKTQTLGISAHGAMMALTGLVAPKQKLVVQNVASGDQQECQVVYVDKDLMGPTKVAVEFTRPAPSFWGIAYPPADWNTHGLP
jgi:hypothetical protein